MKRSEIIELAKLTNATSPSDKARAKVLMDKAIRQTAMDYKRVLDGNPFLRAYLWVHAAWAAITLHWSKRSG